MPKTLKSSQEVWRPICGFDDIYEISNLGRFRSVDRVNVNINGQVRRLKGRVLVQKSVGAGYVGITISDRRQSPKMFTRITHRVVAETFVERPPGTTEVNHINGDRTDNRACNLEWVTPRQNMAHAKATGLWSSVGSLNPMSKLTEADVAEIKARLADGGLQARIAADYGVSVGTITFISQGRTWRHVEAA